MMQRLLVPACLLLPIVGLTYSWIATEVESHQGVIWEVPITGYDPRDLLRGHYVQFRYEWPGDENISEDEMFRYSGNVICIRGEPPHITRTEPLNPMDQDHVEQRNTCASVAEYNPWSEEGSGGLENDRIYLPQDTAREYQDKLMDPDLEAFARVRVNNSNHLIPVEIRFRARDDQSIERQETTDDE